MPISTFGYYKDDGFKKKKNLGRVEQIDMLTEKSKWIEIEAKWIDTYRRSEVIDGFLLCIRLQVTTNGSVKRI